MSRARSDYLSSRSSSLTSQARLLQCRGDLCGQRAVFNVKLPEPTPLALLAENPLDRLGMDLCCGKVRARLVVAGVDKECRKRTPVARWNLQEERNADRSEDEQHASFALLPGDRLRAVNGKSGSETAMLAEVLGAMDCCSPKEMDLSVSRNISDVMSPSPDCWRPCTAPAPLLPTLLSVPQSRSKSKPLRMSSQDSTPPPTLSSPPQSRSSTKSAPLHGSQESTTPPRMPSRPSSTKCIPRASSAGACVVGYSSPVHLRSRSGSKRVTRQDRRGEVPSIRASMSGMDGIDAYLLARFL